MKNVLLIAGPGGTAFDNKLVEEFEKNISQKQETNVFVIGNGKDDVDYELLNLQLEHLKNKKEPLTIIMQTHGEVTNGQFEFKMKNKENMTSEKFFSMCKEIENLDILINSCHGGACMKDKDILNKGTMLISLSQGNQSVTGSDVKPFSENIKNMDEEINAYNLLKVYLSESMKNRIPPEIGISGEIGSIQLDALLDKSMYKKVNRENIDSGLIFYNEPQKLQEIIKKMENGKNEMEEFSAINYGKALSVALVSEFGDSITQDNYHSYRKSKDILSRDSTVGFLKVTAHSTKGLSLPPGVLHLMENHYKGEIR